MFWRKKRDNWERPQPPARITLDAVGYVRNNVSKPRPRGWERLESTIEMLPEHEARLQGIERYSHIIVVFYLDIAEGAPEKPGQPTLESGNTYGIFATRSQLRPNHLGVAAVAMLSHDGGSLRVRGLDAVDGTPVLDIKPYLPAYDAIGDARVP